MNKKRINFFQGHICVKTEDDRLCFVNDVCIPKIKVRIDKFIKDNPKQFKTRTIIFTVLENYFKISHTFRTPNHTSVTPFDDPLYTELLLYISSNPIYKDRLQKICEQNNSRHNIIFKKKKSDIIVWSYEKERRLKKIKKLGKK